MADLANTLRVKARTGWAILAAFIINLLLILTYGLFFAFLTTLGEQYDHSGSWKLFALIALVVPVSLGGYGAILGACKIFKHANVQTIFYSFATGMVIFLLASLIRHSDEIILNTIQTIFSITGAWIAFVRRAAESELLGRA